MNLSMLNQSAQDSILNHKEANEFASKFDSTDYSAEEGRTFSVLGYNYEDGVLSFVESKKFSY